MRVRILDSMERMFRNREVRQLAMQVLFAWDAVAEAKPEHAEQIIRDVDVTDDARSAAMQMARGVWEQRETIDQRLERLAPQWPPRRQPAVDRNILRLAVWEMTNDPTPPKVVIDEAIELAKEFSTEQSPAFINGVLDAVLKENKTLTENPNDQAPMTSK
jgi:transcription antitermination protein NusB